MTIFGSVSEKYPSNWPYTHPLRTQYRISESFSLEDDRWTSLPQSWVRATALAGNLVAYLQVRLRTNVKLPCKEGASAASTTKFFNALASDSDQARFTFSPLLPSTLITFPDQESDSGTFARLPNLRHRHLLGLSLTMSNGTSKSDGIHISTSKAPTTSSSPESPPTP